MAHFPNTILGLIEQIEQQYPPKCIGPNQTEAAAQRYAGKAELVEELRARYDAAQKRARHDNPLS